MNVVFDKFLETDFSSDYIQLQNEYLSTNVSYFDHWLSEDEYQSADIVCYSDTESNIDNIKLFEEIQSQFISFYELLFKLAGENVYVLLDRYWSKHIGMPSKIESYDAYVTYIIGALKEKQLCSLFFPDLNCLILTGYDLTHEFYILKDSSNNELNVLEKIKNSANAVGLYILK